ncbi:DNA/RNA nuclease SfsA [Lachnospiraceae bacterium 54-53]
MQNNYMLTSIQKGIFVKEIENRFLCQVIVDGIQQICYIPSSCRLDNFIDLEGKSILLIPTKGRKNATKFAVLAVEFKRNYIILNSNLANRVVEQGITSRRFFYLGKRSLVRREFIVDDYKCDLYIEDSDTLIEIKSIITLKDVEIFPSVYSKRALRQLDQLYWCLKNGRNVVYIIISMNPYLKSIYLDSKSEFYSKYVRCINKGMKAVAYTCRLNKEMSIELYKQIGIDY